MIGRYNIFAWILAPLTHDLRPVCYGSGPPPARTRGPQLEAKCLVIILTHVIALNATTHVELTSVLKVSYAKARKAPCIILIVKLN